MAVHKGEFDVEILEDLINQGYQGRELLEKFISMREKVPAAFEKMMQDLIDQSKSESHAVQETFGDEYS